MAPACADDPHSGSVTRLLSEVRAGRPSAFDALVPLVYDELHGLARAQRLGWRGDPTLNTTALLHEAYLKLAAPEAPDWESRVHFLSVAARAMRQVLVDYARYSRYRACGLYDELGETEKAKVACEAFLLAWQDADPDLPQPQEVSEVLARL